MWVNCPFSTRKRYHPRLFESETGFQHNYSTSIIAQQLCLWMGYRVLLNARNCVKKLPKKCTYKMDLEFEPGKARREKKKKERGSCDLLFSRYSLDPLAERTPFEKSLSLRTKDNADCVCAEVLWERKKKERKKTRVLRKWRARCWLWESSSRKNSYQLHWDPLCICWTTTQADGLKLEC